LVATRSQSDWDTFARLDARWAILTRSERKFHRWDDRAFFATGQQEIDDFLEGLRQRAIGLARGRALDFGCGLGRLTRALGRHFDRVVGVDISAEMIRQARRLHGEHPRLEFMHNPRADLRALTSDQFDLVYSFITLQHVPDAARVMVYLRDFLRVLKPGGLLFFQLPSVSDYPPLRSALLRLRAWAFAGLTRLGVSPQTCFRSLRLAPYLHMTHVPTNRVKALFAADAAVLEVRHEGRTDTQYLIRKEAGQERGDSGGQ
jgi:SAM-dependent methyltransferase